jgi:hypothetical protein
MTYVVLMVADARIADCAFVSVRKGVVGEVPEALSSPVGET